MLWPKIWKLSISQCLRIKMLLPFGQILFYLFHFFFFFFKCVLALVASSSTRLMNSWWGRVLFHLISFYFSKPLLRTIYLYWSNIVSSHFYLEIPIIRNKYWLIRRKVLFLLFNTFLWNAYSVPGTENRAE